ncbi:MAG: hypothetical protein FD167_296, partial [bacterium]
NRLIKVSSDASGNDIIARYFYDGNGWRVKKVTPSVTTRFVYDQGGRLLSEYDGETVAINSATREHIYAPSGMLATVEPDRVNYHTPDHLGSPRILTDATGSVISRRDYYPFGEMMPDSIGNRFGVPGYSVTDTVKQRFTGYFKDEETGLDFAQARHFNGALGRFMQPDEFTGGPVELYNFADDASDNPTFYADLHEPQSLNKYQYCYNNPLIYADPSGHGLISKIAKIAYKVYKKGDAAEAFADVADNVLVIAGSASKTDKAIAIASLASEAAPVSIGDLKEIVSVVKSIKKHFEKTEKIADAAKKAEKVADTATTVLRKQGGKFTEPSLPAKTLGKGKDTTVVHFTRSGDHAPAHAHVLDKDGKTATRVGQNRKPIEDDPEPTAKQQQVLDDNKQKIRRGINKIQRYHKFHNKIDD